MDLGLSGKVALVTAASKGLGRAVAEALAAEGARLAICSRDAGAIEGIAAEIRRATGAQVLGLAADVSRKADLEGFIAGAQEAYGGVDILVNNAGGPPAGSLLDLDDAAWEAAFQLTLMSVVRATRAVVPLLRQRGGGVIVNLTSSSVREPIAGLILSNTFRPAVVGLAKTLATELAPHGIRVVNVAPGRIDTERVRHLDALRARRTGRPVDEVQREVAAAIPMGRYGRPAEFGRAVAFLTSDAASYITGTTLLVDGGMVRSL